MLGDALNSPPTQDCDFYVCVGVSKAGPQTRPPPLLFEEPLSPKHVSEDWDDDPPCSKLHSSRRLRPEKMGDIGFRGRVHGLGFRVWGLGFMVWSFEFRVGTIRDLTYL